MSMLWEDARSSNIAKVGYDEETGQLHVMFHSGAVYQYDNVPKEVYETFKENHFSGRCLNATIKGRYDYSRIH